jgi:hypothetical protein
MCGKSQETVPSLKRILHDINMGVSFMIVDGVIRERTSEGFEKKCAVYSYLSTYVT